MRDLPAIAAFADDIILALGEGKKHILAGGDWPVAAIEIAGRCRLLLRDHGHSVAISLPTQHSWQFSQLRDWHKSVPEIKKTLSTYLKDHEQLPSLADVILALRLTAWVPQFPGTPVPTEAWLKKPDEPRLSIGLFQDDAAVRVIVWVLNDMRSQALTTPSQLDKLPEWIAPHITAQRAAEAAAAADEERRRALPLPAVSEVMARLEAGERIATGGGRYFETFFIENGKLRREIFDEGYSEVVDATQQQLQESITLLPDRFRKEL